MSTNDNAIPLVAVTNLSVRYGEIAALKDVSLRLLPGQITALVGPNGAGKTTLFRTMFGEQEKLSGSVSIVGLDPFCAHQRRSLWKVARFVSDEPAYYENLTVEEWFRFLARAYGVPPSRLAAVVTSSVTNFELGDVLHRQIHELPSGTKQKVHVAGGFFSGTDGPRILVLDEPTKAFDPLSRTMFADLIRRWVKQGSKQSNRAALLSSHLLAELSSLADSVIILNEGAIIEEGPIDVMLAAHEGLLKYVITLFDSNAVDLAEAMTTECSVPARATGSRTVTYSCQNEPDVVQGLLRWLCTRANRFRIQEMREQRSPLDRIYAERFSRGD